MGVPLYVICHFSLVVFNILPVFNFCQFDNCESWCVPPWDYPAWDPLCFLELVDCFLYYVWEVFSYYLLKYFLRSFLSLSSFWDPYNVNVGAFNVVPEVSCHCFSFFSLLILFCIWSCSSDFHHSVLQVIYTFFCLSYSLLFPSSVLFISVCSLVLVGLW